MTRQERQRLTDALRAAITESELSAYEIAKRSGVDQASLSRFVSGKRSLTVESIEKLAPVLGIEITARRKRKA